MEISTFKDDLLDLTGFATRLEKFIQVEHEFVQGGLVIGLSSKFGFGKTTFLKMWKASLESDESKKYLVIYLNSWESDYYGDPLFAIISSLIEAVKNHGESANTLINAAKDVGWFATAIGSQVVSKFTGIDPTSAGEFAEKKREKRSHSGSISLDSFSLYEGRKQAMTELQKVIKEFVGASEPRILFLVDELDRCRPDYAISYLETIKHIFDIQGAVFILAADRHHLENSAKTAFGSNLDFEEYYRKFVHREVSLPALSEGSYRNLANVYSKYYLERESLRHCFLRIDSYRVDNILELVAGLKLTPRQIQEVFRIIGHTLETSESNKGNLLWCLGVGTIAMAAFKVGNPRIYNLLGSQGFEPRDALSTLESLSIKHSDWWFILFLTGGGIKVPEGVSAFNILVELGLAAKDEEEAYKTRLAQWGHGWGFWGGEYSTRFAQIREKIDQVSQWN